VKIVNAYVLDGGAKVIVKQDEAGISLAMPEVMHKNVVIVMEADKNVEDVAVVNGK
jgi:hypothetical protein